MSTFSVEGVMCAAQETFRDFLKDALVQSSNTFTAPSLSPSNKKNMTGSDCAMQTASCTSSSINGKTVETEGSKSGAV